jgi:hypothetical protein
MSTREPDEQEGWQTVGSRPAASLSDQSTRAEDKARLAQQGIRVQAGEGGYYVIVATGVDRADAERVAEAAYEAVRR